MLKYLSDKTSHRKLILFAVACCRRVWRLLARGPNRRVVEVAEQKLDHRDSADPRTLSSPVVTGSVPAALWPMPSTLSATPPPRRTPLPQPPRSPSWRPG